MPENRTRNSGVEPFRFPEPGWRSTPRLLLAAFLLLGAEDLSRAQTDLPAPPDTAINPSGVRRALLICGLPGDEEHRRLFADSLERLYSGLITHHGFAPQHAVVLWGDEVTESDGPALRLSRGPTTRETLTQTAEELRASLAADDALWVFVLGHAHFDGRYSWLNISGPDMQHLEFGQLFERLPAREEVFFITTACSGFYLKPLAMPGRVVITATEPDLEVNETLFPNELATALGEPPAYDELEEDQDGQLTLLDLYLWTSRQVAQEYVTGELLATEHALIDDNGDGRGTEVQINYLSEELGGRRRAGQEPPPLKSDGLRAREIVLSWPKPENSETQPAPSSDSTDALSTPKSPESTEEAVPAAPTDAG